ncbi:MAG: sigma 54-interacting transcriptional regulator [Planctomycetota bacterium]|jgi:Nif-specific regulatory protein
MDDAPSINTPMDHEALLALIDASRAINEEPRPAGVCKRLAERAAAVLDAEASSVLLHDADRDELVFHTVIGPKSSAAIQSQRFSADLGIAGRVVKTRRAMRVDDVSKNKYFYPGIDELTKRKTRNLLAAPLIYRKEVLGVVEVINRRGGKPFGQEDLELLEVFANLVTGAARNAQTLERLHHENRGLRESIPQANFIGTSAAFKNVYRMCEKVAPTGLTVLLQGESGTGKEMAAHAIHALSPRRDQPFIAVNCAALPETLIESELFGHEKGAYTGAATQAPGRFELAHGGTLLLDEIGELELSMQSKLLRVIETQQITRVGGTQTIFCDVRVIAATNGDLKSRVEAGLFRKDLYYRLGVFPIELPPLRERLEDLPLLTEHLIAQVAPALTVKPPTVSREAMACMRRYHWPGNVRELRNVVERATLLAEGHITPEHLPHEIAGAAADADSAPGSGPPDDPISVLAETERELIAKALKETNWNQSAAARGLGISRDILRYRIKRYRITRTG